MTTGGPGSKLAIADGDMFSASLTFEHIGKGERVYVYYRIKVLDIYEDSVSSYVSIAEHANWTPVTISTNPAVFDNRGLVPDRTIDGDVVLVRDDGTELGKVFVGDALMIYGKMITLYAINFSPGVTQWSAYWKRGNTSWKMPGWPTTGQPCVIGALPLGEIFQVYIYEYISATGQVIGHGPYNVVVMTIGPYTWNVQLGSLV
mgnify:CR=1 FL=1